MPTFDVLPGDGHELFPGVDVQGRNLASVSLTWTKIGKLIQNTAPSSLYTTRREGRDRSPEIRQQVYLMAGFPRGILFRRCVRRAVIKRASPRGVDCGFCGNGEHISTDHTPHVRCRPPATRSLLWAPCLDVVLGSMTQHACCCSSAQRS